MNRIGETTHSSGDGPSLDREIRELLRTAGPRPRVPDEQLKSIKTAARAEWERLIAAHRKRRSGFWPSAAVAAAATLAVALAAAWWWTGRQGPAAVESVATVELLRGEVSSTSSELATGAALAGGSELATAEAVAGPVALAIRMKSGHSVRLAADSRVRLTSGSAFELVRGAVYVDSGGSGVAGSGIEISTALGAVRDIGTQFELRIENDGAAALRLRVREGEVLVSRGAASHAAAAGEELTVRRDGTVARGAVALRGPDWEWAVMAAPGLDIEGLTLGEYLEWLVRETGLAVRFNDEELAESALNIELFGSIEGLSPIESLEVVVPGSGLDYEVAGDELEIRARPVA